MEPSRLLLRRLLLLLLCAAGLYTSALRAATRPNYQPTIVDVNLATGGVTVSGPDRDLASAPGSTLKPIVLLTALRLGIVTPGTRVACDGMLRLGGRNLACAHPRSLGVLDAEEALSYSCNTYFARVAQLLPPMALQAAVQAYGLHSTLSTTAPEARVLLALGLQDVAVTPLQLARAYVQLARALQQGSTATDTVRAGLLGSVAYGMAHAAQTPGVVLGGKTGTAHDPAPRLQHGWFAGIAFAAKNEPLPTHVLVVYNPAGSGNDAAMAAHRYLQSRPW